MSIFFYGWGYADRSYNSVRYHFGWGDGELGQYFASHGNCLPTSHAAECPGCAPGGDQWHIRIKKTTDEDANLNVTSAGTPHRERGCPGIGGGHGVTENGFQEARERIIDGLWWRGDHGWQGYQWWGNTDMREPECGSWWAWHDGNAGLVYQHYSFH